MFATVIHGDGQSFLINLRCGSRSVFEYVNDKLAEEDWEDETFVELADEDGHLKYLSYQRPMRTLLDLVKPRSTLIPIKIDRDENDSFKPFTPMLKTTDFKPKFIERLQRQRDKMEKLRVEREGGTAANRRLESVKEETRPKDSTIKRQASGTRPVSKGIIKRP